MRRKKSAVPATVVGTESVPQSEGVIDLDSMPDAEEPEIKHHLVSQGVINGSELGLDEVAGDPNDGLNSKPKRKYTRRKKTGSGASTTVPSFVDLDAIRSARIQVFTDYIDSKITFDQAAVRDEQFRKLREAAYEIVSNKNNA